MKNTRFGTLVPLPLEPSLEPSRTLSFRSHIGSSFNYGSGSGRGHPSTLRDGSSTGSTWWRDPDNPENWWRDPNPQRCYFLQGLQRRRLLAALGAMAAQRQRFNGTAAQLTEILEPFVKKVGFISYGDDLAKSPVEPSLIVEHKSLMQVLAKLRPVSQAAMVKSLVCLHEYNKHVMQTWELQDKDAIPWAASSAKRLRCMTLHTIQELSSKKPASWVKLLGLDTEEAIAPQLESDTSRKGTKSDIVWYYGWDHDTQKAWRAPSDHPSRKEVSWKIIVPENAVATQPVRAAFGNCLDEIDIPEMTVEQYEQIASGMEVGTVITHKSKKKLKPTQNNLLELRTTSGSKLKLRAKSIDKKKGFVLFEDGSQILQTIWERYPASDMCANDDDKAMLGLHIMNGIAFQYSKDLVENENLSKLRDAELKAALSATTATTSETAKTVKKRPVTQHTTPAAKKNKVNAIQQ